MSPSRASIAAQFFSWKYATLVAALALFLSLNSTLLFFSHLLQLSNSRFYHHGESKSLMSANTAGSHSTQGQNWHGNDFSPVSAFRTAFGSSSSSTDNIAGKNLDYMIHSPPVDVVYTWVNGSDPRQVKALLKAKLEAMKFPNGTAMRLCLQNETAELDGCFKDEETASRFQDNEEMRYSLRSVWKYAPWVRNIYVVTNGQIPNWLNLNHPRLRLVSHESLFPNKSHLPTFSSPAIEAHLHRIEGLAEHFVYLNDDVMFGREVYPSDFYTPGNGQRVYLSWPVPDCAEGCSGAWLGDGHCDVSCNVSMCDFDAGDCENSTAPIQPTWSWGSTPTSPSPSCSPGCLDSWIGDRYCDRVCRNPECAMDAGDCGADLVYTNIDGLALSSQHTFRWNPTSTGLNLYTLKIPSIHIGARSLGHHFDYSDIKYFNLSALVGDDTIIESAHSDTNLIRLMVVSPKNKFIILLFNPSARSAGIPSDDTTTEEQSSSQTISEADLEQAQKTPSNETDSSTSSETSKPSPSNGRIFVTLTTLDEDSKKKTEYMFYIQLHQVSEAQRKQADSSTKSGDTSTSSETTDDISVSLPNGMTRSLQSVESVDFASKSNPALSNDPKAIISEANPKLEERTLGKLHRGGMTRAQIDEEKAILRRSGRMGFDFTRQPDNPFKIVDGQVEEKIGSENSATGGSRRLLDNYADSLKHVNNLLTRQFGAASRRVPAHMPHYLQKSIIQRMQKLWQREFDVTSSHRTRSGSDMQYSFSYFYYLMSEKVPYNFNEVWTNELDLDGDGVLNANEMRTVATTLVRSEFAYPKPNPRIAFTNWNHWAAFQTDEPSSEPIFQWLRKCDSIWLEWSPANESTPTPLTKSLSESNSTKEDEVPSNATTTAAPKATTFLYVSDRVKSEVGTFPRNWTLTKESLQSCSHAFTPLELHYKARLKNRFEMGNEDEVAFVMVPTNRTTALASIDGIRADRNKFVCLNDNINHTSPDAADVVQVLHDFYQALFPLPSPFELPHGETNKFLYLEELDAYKETIGSKKLQLYAALAVIFVVLFVLWKVFSRRKVSAPRRHID